MKIIYPGSYDPFHHGHLDIFTKIADIFTLNADIKILVMNSDTKKHLFSMYKRTSLIKEALKNIMPVDQVDNYVESFDGNINDYIEQELQSIIIIRGLRNSADFDYEMVYESFTRRFSAQTIYCTPNPKNSFISSSLIRNLINTNAEFEDLVPWKQ